MIWIVRKSSLILLMTNRTDKFFMADSAREMAVSMKSKVSAVWFLEEPPPEPPLPAEGLEPGVLPPEESLFPFPPEESRIVSLFTGYLPDI